MERSVKYLEIFCSDINPLRDLRYALTRPICASHTICPAERWGIYIISQTSLASLYRILRSKIYRNAKHYIAKKTADAVFFSEE